jgi:hypothetical protein
MEHTF